MASITDLDYTNNMSANKKPFLTDLVETLDSIESYINTTVVDAIMDIVQDGWPSGYAFTANGTGNFTTFNLYDKQTSQSTYTGGDITISTTGAWTDVDASNAAITITPNGLTGDFRVTFHFNVSVVSTNATNEADIRFRLTDSTTNSDPIQKVRIISGVNATTFEIPVSLSYEFDAWTTSAKTVKLQYFIVTTTASTIKVLANSNAPIAKQAEKI